MAVSPENKTGSGIRESSRPCPTCGLVLLCPGHLELDFLNFLDNTHGEWTSQRQGSAADTTNKLITASDKLWLALELLQLRSLSLSRAHISNRDTKL